MSQGKNHDKEVYTILKLTPDLNDNINGKNYFRRDYVKGGEIIYAEIYGFNLKICSTCGKK